MGTHPSWKPDAAHSLTPRWHKSGKHPRNGRAKPQPLADDRIEIRQVSQCVQCYLISATELIADLFHDERELVRAADEIVEGPRQCGGGRLATSRRQDHEGAVNFLGSHSCY